MIISSSTATVILLVLLIVVILINNNSPKLRKSPFGDTIIFILSFTLAVLLSQMASQAQTASSVIFDSIMACFWLFWAIWFAISAIIKTVRL